MNLLGKGKEYDAGLMEISGGSALRAKKNQVNSAPTFDKFASECNYLVGQIRLLQNQVQEKDAAVKSLNDQL